MKRLIIIRGASGAGKSSIATLLVKKLGNKTAHVPVDITPFSFMVDYLKIPHVKMSNLSYDNAECLVRNFLKANLSVVTDHMFSRYTKNKSRLEIMIRIGKRNGAKVIVIELIADLSTLERRAKKRARYEDVSNKFKKIGKRRKKFLRTRHKGAIQIDTNNKTKYQIVNEILEKI
jgi:archaellum biogenesis ATPase FlaH